MPSTVIVKARWPFFRHQRQVPSFSVTLARQPPFSRYVSKNFNSGFSNYPDLDQHESKIDSKFSFASFEGRGIVSEAFCEVTFKLYDFHFHIKTLILMTQPGVNYFTLTSILHGNTSGSRCVPAVRTGGVGVVLPCAGRFG